MRACVFVLPIALFVLSCNNPDVKTTPAKKDSASAKPDALAVNMDSSISPSQNFFLFADGGWIKRNPIPGDQGSWGIGNLVVEENLERLRQISIKAAAAKATSGS